MCLKVQVEDRMEKLPLLGDTTLAGRESGVRCTTSHMIERNLLEKPVYLIRMIWIINDYKA
jgi:hypothetical protein